MAIRISEISEKYINSLGKGYFNTVKFSEASSAIKKAVEETAEVAKKEIKEAIKPLSDKIVKQDEFISSQTKINEDLKKENEGLKQNLQKVREFSKSQDEAYKESRQTINDLQTKIDTYKPIVKEAYKQNITQEIRDKKSGLASILSGLIRRHEELSKPIIAEKPVITEPIKVAEKPVIQKTEKIAKAKKSHQIKRPKVSSEIIKEIEAQRKNQKLDIERINKAQSLIRLLLEDAPQKDSYTGVQEYFQKTMDKYVKDVNSIVNGRYKYENDRYGKIRIGTDENGKIILKQRGTDFSNNFHPYKHEIFLKDGSSMEIYDGSSDSYIEFRDTEGKKLIKICYSDHYSVFISDKNGRLMISESIKDGVVKHLDVRFNEVKPIAEIENDEAMNVYAQNLVSKAKRDCKSKQSEYRDTSDIDYFNSEGKITVHEYFVNKQRNPDPIFTYLYDTKDEQLEKLITNGDFGIHAKYDEKMRCFVQYRTKGITGIDKRRKNSDLKDFRIGFYKSTENEHYEVQSLYDKNYSGDKDSFLQREVYKKRNYGLASHPLTQSFTFSDLSKHQIKPWDFSILKPYIL